MSNVQMFIINNAGMLVSLLVASAGIFGGIVSGKKQQVLTNIFGVIPQAEQLVDKTGLDKFNYVLDNTYGKLPAIFKFFISEDDVKMAIEYSLNKIKVFAAQQQSGQDTSTQDKSNSAANNTNVPTGADLATQTVQNTSTLTTDEINSLASIAQKLQNTVNTAQ